MCDCRARDLVTASLISSVCERFDAQPSAPSGSVPELEAEASQDLFIYPIAKMTLAKGARATVPLWQHTGVPLRHLYTVDIGVGRDFRGGSAYRKGQRQQRRSPMDLLKNEVWHQLELENKTKTPWTTGAALTSRRLRRTIG